ncbi:MAG TPA: DUF2798 domain-containing protein [Vitreimonas sp.]|uniref:DUF2798 domain-containing protein n=1 Tax=Vitreimonas sp. TaxID=3069702 RepID=UPI002D49C470|nr:DUF2798 domain-containing protein [Vitreimonas sp.]HYD88133.1 DUF2798 domain-containing protein [Vitreimonas sp.]
MSQTHSGSRRLPARYAGIVMPVALSIVMSMIVSAVATVKNLGPSAEFFSAWPTAWLASWLIALPTLFLVLPLVRRFVALVVEPAGR